MTTDYYQAAGARLIHIFVAITVGLFAFASGPVMTDEITTQEEQVATSTNLPKAKNIDLDAPAPPPSIATEKPAPMPGSQNTELPKAQNIELDKPIVPETPAPVEEAPILQQHQDDTEQQAETGVESDSALVLLGAEVPPATSTRLSWSPSQSFEGIAIPTPVLVINGANPGPSLCLTAAIHGDELNGIEIVRRVLYNLKPEKLSGAVIGVPIVNLDGFRRASRYLTDRRDLNRFFPGNLSGSSASRTAYSFFNEVISHCDVLVDLHTGSFHRTNLPQLRADLTNPAVANVTQGFGATVVLQSKGAPGTLRRAAVDAGIPAVTLEAGEPMRLQEEAVSHGVKGIHTLLTHLAMQTKKSFWGEPEPVYYRSTWIRANQGGILFSKVDLGERVKQGQVLGTITDPITNIRTEVISPYRGRVLGMALNQVVMPGFAAYRIGIQTPEGEMTEPQPEQPAIPIEPVPEEGYEEEPDIAAAEADESNLDALDSLENSE